MPNNDDYPGELRNEDDRATYTLAFEDDFNRTFPKRAADTNGDGPRSISPENAKRLVKMTVRLFDLWELSEADRLCLLGHSPENPVSLAACRKGEVGIVSEEASERVCAMMSIHGRLYDLYGDAPKRLYSWVHRKNGNLDDQTPLEIMLGEDIDGVRRVLCLLNWLVHR